MALIISCPIATSAFLLPFRTINHPPPNPSPESSSLVDRDGGDRNSSVSSVEMSLVVVSIVVRSDDDNDDDDNIFVVASCRVVSRLRTFCHNVKLPFWSESTTTAGCGW